MAMYHFRLKSDKKPNGTKISAVQHVEYINREGKFSTPEHWKQTNKFVGNFIMTTGHQMHLADLMRSFIRPMILAPSEILSAGLKSLKIFPTPQMVR